MILLSYDAKRIGKAEIPLFVVSSGPTIKN